jgi:FkbM family methyltransferase
VDLRWLYRNILLSWRSGDRLIDALRRIQWIYADKLPSFARRDRFELGFKYNQPVGRIRLLVRNNRGCDHFIHSEVFEHRYYDIPLISTPETILDLGANTGFSAVFFGRTFPKAKIACVEPIASNLEVLRENLRLNGIRADVFAGAIDATDGKVLMEVGEKDYGHHIAGMNAPPESLKEAPSYSVPSILERLQWRRIGLMKIDIEGHERTLLSHNCDWLALVDALCVEWHYEDAEEKLNEIARKYGFSTPELRPGIWFMSRRKAGIR